MVGEYARVDVAKFNELRRLDPDDAYEAVDDLDPSTTMDIDKSWDALRVLMLADGAPVDVIDGGDPFASEEWAYDVPRYLTAAEVATAADYLIRTSWASLAGHFDGVVAGRQDVYQGEWTASHLDYLAANYKALADFFAAAAHAHQLVILWKS